MPVVARVPFNNFTGSVQSPAESVPDAATSWALELDATTTSMLNAALRLSIQMDFSPDGGVTWASTSPGPTMPPFPVTATYSAPFANPKTGLPVATVGPTGPFPSGTSRQVRGNLIVDGGSITTTLAVSVFP